VLKLIEKRQKLDKNLVYGGMVVTVVLMFSLLYWKFVAK